MIKNYVMKGMNKFLLVGLIALSFTKINAQCTEWNWPEDKATAEEKNVLYGDALRVDNFKAAQAPHNWLLTNAPDLQVAIYQNGEKIYKGLIEETSDEAQKDIYIDSLMIIYDMRVKYCNSEAEVISRKAYSAYRYNIKKKSEMPNILALFDRAYELNGNDMDYYLLLPYMQVVVYNAQYIENLSDDEILERYDNINQVIDYQISQGKNVAKLEQYKSAIDGLIVKVIDFDCDMVRSKLGPQFNAEPENLKLAKKIFGFMLNGKCTDDPLWLEAGKKIQEKEPEYGLAKNIALKCKAAGDRECAEKYFNEAISLSDDPSNIADIYIQLGSMRGGSAARSYYEKAIAADPTKNEAYSAIGYLYYQSFNDCAGKEDIVKDRAVFLAAYDMFSRGGNGEMMSKSKEQFPSKEEIFTYNYSAGDQISVGCWIGVNTTIRSRD